MIAFASTKEAMQSQQKLASNPILVNLNKFHSKKAISSLKQKIVFITSPKAVNASQQLVKILIKVKALLPTTPDEFGDIQLYTDFKDEVIKNLQTINDFLLWSQVYEPDDKNTKTLIKNLQLSSEYLDYIVDYVTIAIKSQEAINELKNSKETYTFEQAKKLISGFAA